jgi:hypothetical protein
METQQAKMYKNYKNQAKVTQNECSHLVQQYMLNQATIVHLLVHHTIKMQTFFTLMI